MKFSAAGIDRLLQSAPFASETWDRVDGLSQEQHDAYWMRIWPRWFVREEAQVVNRVVDKLLAAARPRAAFHAAHMVFSVLTSDRLLRLLHDIGTRDTEPEGTYQISQHDISEAFDVLSSRSDVRREELVRLEFLFIDALSHTKHGIRNLERELASVPSLFVQALAYAFKRRDGAEDPVELRRPADVDAAANLASAAYQLLTRAKFLPGMRDTGEIDPRGLREWVLQARQLAREYGREAIGDQMIGHLLAHSPTGQDGVWPVEAVREVLEEVGTPDVAKGMHMGRYNARGAHWRGEGGGDERNLALQYRNWSRQVAARHPFTARVLSEMADSNEHEAKWHDNESAISRRLRY